MKKLCKHKPFKHSPVSYRHCVHQLRPLGVAIPGGLVLIGDTLSLVLMKDVKGSLRMLPTFKDQSLCRGI